MAKRTQTILASASRTSTANSNSQECDTKGAQFYLDVTAVTGTTPTLDVKIQAWVVGTSATWIDLPGALFAQATGTGTQILTVYPGVTQTAQEAVSDVMPAIFRAVATIGGTSPDFTFSLTAAYVD